MSNYANHAILSPRSTIGINVPHDNKPKAHITDILPPELHIGILESLVAKEVTPDALRRWLLSCPRALEVFRSYNRRIMERKSEATGKDVMSSWFNFDSQHTMAAHSACRDQAALLMEWRDVQEYFTSDECMEALARRPLIMEVDKIAAPARRPLMEVDKNAGVKRKRDSEESNGDNMGSSSKRHHSTH
ncbi:hypothetical protein EDC01DRAFT_788728 [Geopyxis carbonaria]|nr:hypothetical protein EDC01DRAFT_788728 [Geopyxis carbonaria]